MTPNALTALLAVAVMLLAAAGVAALIGWLAGQIMPADVPDPDEDRL